jgi:hypothetical protein
MSPDRHSPLPQYVLSIRQPWLWAIMHAGKRLENRSWRTSFRGSLYLHASRQLASASAIAECRKLTAEVGISLPTPREWPRGEILCIADLVDCVASTEIPPEAAHWADATGWVFLLDRIVELKIPLPHMGSLGIHRHRAQGRRIDFARRNVGIY